MPHTQQRKLKRQLTRYGVSCRIYTALNHTHLTLYNISPNTFEDIQPLLTDIPFVARQYSTEIIMEAWHYLHAANNLPLHYPTPKNYYIPSLAVDVNTLLQKTLHDTQDFWDQLT